MAHAGFRRTNGPFRPHLPGGLINAGINGFQILRHLLLYDCGEVNTKGGSCGVDLSRKFIKGARKVQTEICVPEVLVDVGVPHKRNCL